MISVAIDYARYYWHHRDIFVDLPLRVAFAARRPLSNSCEYIYDVWVSCGREWYYNFDDADALILDSSDENATSVLRSGGNPIIKHYNEMLAELTLILVGKYVIVDDYKALGETLRIELPFYCLFDVATNILERNESLRRGGHLWQRSGSVVAPLAELWPNFFDASLDSRNTATVASGMRTIFMNVEQKYAHNYFIFVTPAAANCPWRSTLTTTIHLKTFFHTECQFERYRTRLNYSLRKREWSRPPLKSAMRFRVEIDVGDQRDPMMARSVNAHLREYAVADVALLRLLKEHNVSVDTDIDRFHSVYEERLHRRVRDALEFRVDHSRAAHSSPSRVFAACCALLRASDAVIDTLARRLVAAGIYYPSGPELIPLHLIEFYDRLHLS